MRNIGKQLRSSCVVCLQWGGQGWSGCHLKPENRQEYKDYMLQFSLLVFILF